MDPVKVGILGLGTVGGGTVNVLQRNAEEIARPDAVLDLHYPALAYPSKVTSFNLDKEPRVEGRLEAIKGQYLILDNGVINIRKYGGYLVSLECGE